MRPAHREVDGLIEKRCRTQSLGPRWRPERPVSDHNVVVGGKLRKGFSRDVFVANPHLRPAGCRLGTADE